MSSENCRGPQEISRPSPPAALGRMDRRPGLAQKLGGGKECLWIPSMSISREYPLDVSSIQCQFDLQTVPPRTWCRTGMASANATARCEESRQRSGPPRMLLHIWLVMWPGSSEGASNRLRHPRLAADHKAQRTCHQRAYPPGESLPRVTP